MCELTRMLRARAVQYPCVVTIILHRSSTGYQDSGKQIIQGRLEKRRTPCKVNARCSSIEDGRRIFRKATFQFPS